MKKRRVLKKWVRYTLYTLEGIVAVIAIVFLIKVNGKMEKDFVDNCESLGYSYNYCVAHS